MFDNDAYLAIYAQIIRDAVVASVEWMPPTCELPSDGGQSDFEKVMQRHLKGSDRKFSSELLADLMAVAQTSSPEEWLSYVVEELSVENDGGLEAAKAIH